MKQDVINLCIDQAVATYRNVNDEYLEFVKQLGGVEHLPSKFTLNVSKMRSLERAIDDAVGDGNLKKTEDLCDEYRDRFNKYLDGWRKVAAKGVAA